MTWQQGIGGWQWQQSGASSSSVVHRKCNSTLPRSWKPGDQAPGASGRARTARQWVVWTKEVQALRVKKSYAAALSTTTETKQLVTGLYLYVETIQHKLDVPVVESSGSREVIRQIKQVEKALSSLDMDAPARKMLEQQLTELNTQQKAQQPLSKRLESARGALQRAQRRAEEARVAFTLDQTFKEQADSNSAHSNIMMMMMIRHNQDPRSNDVAKGIPHCGSVQ